LTNGYELAVEKANAGSGCSGGGLICCRDGFRPEPEVSGALLSVRGVSKRFVGLLAVTTSPSR